ncbi:MULTISPECIES: DMT family transporter [unclassified Marinobacterium]|uniref:DMT family transporter n=1 Tax=unclassified Marinobacterium TaxID=2644139 RepID=UPI00156880B9|nr:MULTISPECIES: DMT family transporter [unclassified Marinobacterium]NRP10629.1 hypothetical protein [Marinobacterium sp. xm-g-48]NRP46749.1 hypothetical protein [Marinobacterium sp. xm-d-543]NRP83667.1 hypothetical protein [Marinobacterium sp. xm-d-509]NRQ23306.1 hypothetical protein [Marinobacterium sp. xm-m-312]
MNNSIVYALVMLLAGIGIPTMATLNGGLGGRLMSSSLATAMALALGFTSVAVYLLVTEGFPSKFVADDLPIYFYLGGFCVAFYVISVTWIVPRFGVSNAIAFALLGQLIAMSTIDHFGLFGAQQYAITLKRIAGLLIMALGIYLVLDKSVANNH